MQLLIKYKENNKMKSKILTIEKQGILGAIDNFLKYDIINSNNLLSIDIKNLEIYYEKQASKSQTSERIASIIRQVLQIVKNF